jgi:hypothetical protein
VTHKQLCAAMLVEILKTILSVLRSVFRSRAALLAEDVVLCQQIIVLQIGPATPARAGGILRLAQPTQGASHRRSGGARRAFLSHAPDPTMGLPDLRFPECSDGTALQASAPDKPHPVLPLERRKAEEPSLCGLSAFACARRGFPRLSNYSVF